MQLSLLLVSMCGGALGVRLGVETVNPTFVRTVHDKGYVKHARADPDAMLKLTLAVKQTNLAKLENVLMDVSDPRSANYGKHLSHRESRELIRPEAKSVQAVLDWLSEHSLKGSKATFTGDFIDVDATVAQAEKLLGTEYFTYNHTDSGYQVTRVGFQEGLEEEHAPYTVPENVRRHLDFVSPTVTFPPPALLLTHKQKMEQLKQRDEAAFLQKLNAKVKVTPQVLWSMYNVTGSGTGTSSNFTQGVASFIKQYYLMSDLKLFWKKYDMPSTGFSWVDVPADQPHDPVGDESSLDVQWLSSSGQNVNTEHWSTPGVQPGNPENEPFVSWLKDLATAENPPLIFSISYGDVESGVSKDYALRAGTEFQAAGMRGISLLAASGDSGVGCAIGSFAPTFPASCPWVTGVGGTTDGNPGKSPTGETVADLSGGGFSFYFDAPDFQADAIAAYKKTPGLPNQSNWNAKGAGFPDIAAQAIAFDSCTEAFFFPIDGTSCACPAATGVLSRLIQQRVDAGKSSLGFLNPMLYQTAPMYAKVHAFNDVVTGINTHCGDDSGFPAVEGWDPVTGWGTLNMGKLEPIIMAL